MNPVEDEDHPKCTFCHKFLSIPPIFSSIDGQINKCGRCDITESEESKLMRNTIYEKVAKRLRFPCSHSNCTDMLAWDAVRNHENYCPFRQIPCPHKKCRQIYAVNAILEHFGNSHLVYTENVIKHNIFMKPRENVVLINLRQDFFLAYFILKDPFLYITVVTDKETRYSFTIGLESMDGKIEYNRKHKICISPNYTPGLLYKDSAQCIDVKSVNNILQVDSARAISVNLQIFLQDDHVKLSLSSDSIQPCCKDIFLQAIECPICFVPMSSEIYLCDTGHSICKTCKLGTSTCPICRTYTFQGARNYALESLYQKFKDHGTAKK